MSLPSLAPSTTVPAQIVDNDGLAPTMIVGIASMYDPIGLDKEVSANLETASGELYDETAWTAAIRIDLRTRFEGVRFGTNYKPVFALVETANKRAIVKVNDVGPLAPGRVIDLNLRSMQYFDPTLELGLLHDVRVTLLPGTYWTTGPVDRQRRDDTCRQFGAVAALSAPHLLGQLYHHAQLRPLLVLGQRVAFLGRGEAALRRQAELIERNVFRGLLDAALDGRPCSPAAPVLVVTRPSTTWRSFGTSLSGSKPPARSLSYSMK